MATATEVKQRYWTELSEAAGALAANLSKVLRHPGRLAGNALDGGEFWSSEFMVTVNAELPVREDPSRLEAVDAYLAENLLVNLAAEFPEFREIGDWRKVAKDDITPGMIRALNMATHRRKFLEICEVSRSWRQVVDGDATAGALKAFLLLYQGPTLIFYGGYLAKSLPPLGLESTTPQIQRFIDHDCGKKGISAGGRHAYYRAIRAFFNWAFSPASNLGLNPAENAITYVRPPKVEKKLMPAQDEKSFAVLLSHVDNARDRAVIAMLYDSSGRLSEVSNIYEADIIWDKEFVKARAKGGEEVRLPLSEGSRILIKDWLAEFDPKGGPIWGTTKNGIVSMLRRLGEASGVKCNAHTFRRGFASELRRKGVDTLDIMKLGHWKSISMVQRYTESVGFEDSQKHYVAPSEGLVESTHDVPGATRGLPDATRGLSKMTGGLSEVSVVPRNRIELLTRGFSVRCSTY
jgi:integrase